MAGNLRRGLPMAIDENRVEVLSSLLQSAMKKILENDTSFSFEEAYRNAHTMVLQKHGGRLYACLRETITAHLNSKAKDVVACISQKNFIQILNETWNNHTASMTIIRDVLMYMERVYVQQNNVDNIYDLGLKIFRDQIYRYSGIHEKLQETLLNMLRHERNGEVVDSLVIKNVCQMLKDLGLGDRSVYEEGFEQPFLQEIAKIYEIEIQNRSSVYKACIEDLKTRIIEVYEHTKQLLDDVTAARVVAVYEQTLMKKLKDPLLNIAIPAGNNLGPKSPCIDEKDFELPYLHESAEIYELQIGNYTTENIALRFTATINSRLIKLYERGENHSDDFTEDRTIETMEKELVGKLRHAIANMTITERNKEAVDCMATENVLQMLIFLECHASSPSLPNI